MSRLRTFLPAVLLAGAAHLAAADFSSLLSNSPFAPIGPGGAGATGDKSVEFRGMYTDPQKGTTYFSIYDAATQRASWVTLNETGHPFVVRGYNDANDTVTLEFGGHNLNVGLKHATVQLATAPRAPVPGPGPAMNPAEMTPRDRRFAAMNGPDGRPDPKRMEAFIEEMRRRRAQRMQNMANGGGPGAESQGGPQPMPNANPGQPPMGPPVPMPQPDNPNNTNR